MTYQMGTRDTDHECDAEYFSVYTGLHCVENKCVFSFTTWTRVTSLVSEECGRVAAHRSQGRPPQTGVAREVGSQAPSWSLRIR